MNPKHLPGPPMTLGNIRELGVQRLIASCLNDACRHSSPYPSVVYSISRKALRPSMHANIGG
jgi:hypothetical protein